MKHRIYEFDVIRAICALWIIGIWHMPDYISYEFASKFTTSYATQTTYCILSTFTFISGYLTYNTSINSFRESVLFYKKKLLRFYPLFALASVIFVFYSINPKKHLLRTLVGFGCIVAPYPLTIWFLCMILVFYFIIPLLLYHMKRPRIVVLLALFFELIFLLFHKYLNSDIRLMYYWPFFVLGILANKYNIKEKYIFIYESMGFKVPICAKICNLKSEDEVNLKADLGGGEINHTNYNFSNNRFSWLGQYSTILSFPIYILLSNSGGVNFSLLTVLCSLSFIIFIYNISFVFLFSQNIYLIFKKMSYASMSAYLFHRPILQTITNIFGSQTVIVAYASVLPIVFILSYFIQDFYDKVLEFFMNRLYKKMN